MFQLEWLSLVQSFHISLKIKLNGCIFFRICVFQLKQLQFALSMRILVEIVVIGSDYACFT